MSVKRIVDVSFWEDEKVLKEFTPEDMLFFLYLMTNPHTTQLGVYKIVDSQMAHELKLPLEEITNLISKFQKKYGMIKYSYRTSELAIKNYLLYSIVKGGAPVYDLLVKEVKAIKDKSLLFYIIDSASSSNNQTVLRLVDYINNNIDKPINDKENVNENENENEDSYHDSLKWQNLGVYPQNETLIHEKGYDTLTYRDTNRPTYRDTNHNPKYERIIPITSDYGKGEAK